MENRVVFFQFSLVDSLAMMQDYSSDWLIQTKYSASELSYLNYFLYPDREIWL